MNIYKLNLYLHFLLQIVSANFKNYFHHPSDTLVYQRIFLLKM